MYANIQREQRPHIYATIHSCLHRFEGSIGFLLPKFLDMIHNFNPRPYVLYSLMDTLKKILKLIPVATHLPNYKHLAIARSLESYILAIQFKMDIQNLFFSEVFV